jgi:glycosyltransferase involved in cell wall biosynthesis
MTAPDSLTILHCIRAPVGGAFRHVRDLALAQEQAGHRVGIICDSLTGGRFEAAQIEATAPRLTHGIERIPMRRALAPSDLAVAVRLFRRIKGLKPHILHGHGAKGGAYARLIGTGLRLFGQRPARIYCPHGGSLHFDPATLKGRAIFWLERQMERMTDGLHFVSGYEASTYAAKVGQPSIISRLVYNGLQAEEFALSVPSEDARDFLFIGTLRHLKGVDVFIDALDLLNKRGIHATGLIVGDGEMEAAFRKQVSTLGLSGQIAFAPPMPIRAALVKARAMVMPSRAESLPYVVLEAVAAGMPLVTTRVGGIPEIFGDASSRLLPPGDVPALADAMATLMQQPQQAEADVLALRATISDQFAVVTMAASIEALYRDVATPPAKAGTKDDDALLPSLPFPPAGPTQAGKR